VASGRGRGSRKASGTGLKMEIGWGKRARLNGNGHLTTSLSQLLSR